MKAKAGQVHGRSVQIASESMEPFGVVGIDRRVIVNVETWMAPRKQQVVLNLMVNAIEAMDGMPHGQRHLVVRASQPRPGTIEVAVIDRGHGIPTDLLPTLFEPFHTTKATGIGIGVAISRKIVELHGGQIWGENNPEGGATFRFTLKPAEMGSES